MPWRPLLDGDDAIKASAAIEGIAADLMARDDIDDPSLIRGWAGVALFHGYRARCGDPDAAAHAHDALAAALERLGTGDHAPWFGDGYLGIAWVMEHLRDVVEVDDATLVGFDVIARELLSRDEWKHEYELWNGIIGLGVHAFERGRIADVARVVWHLDRLAERTEDGATWWNRDFLDFSDPRADPRGYHNLGLALGVSGAVAFLARACAAGVPAKPLLAEATRWLLAQERPDHFPHFDRYRGPTDPGGQRRNGWCYGDFAAATAFAAAGRALGDRALVEHARQLLLTTARRPIDDPIPIDANFCHGTAGNAQMFARLAHTLDDAELREAARRCAIATVDRLPPPHGDFSLRTGSPGIGLALLAAIHPIDPTWDRLFLIGS